MSESLHPPGAGATFPKLCMSRQSALSLGWSGTAEAFMYLLPNGQPLPPRDPWAEYVSKWRAENGDWIVMDSSSGNVRIEGFGDTLLWP